MVKHTGKHHLLLNTMYYDPHFILPPDANNGGSLPQGCQGKEKYLLPYPLQCLAVPRRGMAQ